SHAFPGVGFCLGEGQEIDWIGHTEYSETRIEQLDHIFNLIGMSAWRLPLRTSERRGLPLLFLGSSRLSGEGRLDFQKKVF
ncbi:hypothetical protein, partial [Aeromonas caviae]|uniref:hypothetical protein n=1 Tax=Aeromonas caviae TaxID=648 RepID=UPI0019D4BFBC